MSSLKWENDKPLIKQFIGKFYKGTEIKTIEHMETKAAFLINGELEIGYWVFVKEMVLNE